MNIDYNHPFIKQYLEYQIEGILSFARRLKSFAEIQCPAETNELFNSQIRTVETINNVIALLR